MSKAKRAASSRRRSGATDPSRVRAIVAAAKRLRDGASAIEFSDPVTHVYNPLEYAWKPHLAYLKKASPSTCQVLMLGMNPGPWGMAQTGVPFGEIAAVRDYLGIEAKVDSPDGQHPKRPVEGFGCGKSEVSGRRLWGLMAERFESSDDFFRTHFVVNYCPLVFMEASAKNRTPDKLSVDEQAAVNAICDDHLLAMIAELSPSHLVGIGAYAEKCLARVTKAAGIDLPISRILHPSPASPAANRDWAGKASGAMVEAGIWN